MVARRAPRHPSAAPHRAIAAVCALLGAALIGLTPAAAQLNINPKEMEGVQIVEHLGDKLPLDLTFRDETGAPVRLGQYFGGERPVLVTLVYFNCPMLCNLVLNGAIEGLRGVDFTPGEDFEIVTVSIDHREGPELAAAKKKNYLEQYARPGAEKGWHFLTGDAEQIRALADAIGFGYRYDPDRMEYAHGAAIFFASPEGKLTRYLYGIQHEPKQLHLALVEAGQGKIGSAVDRFMLRCYMYNPDSREYAFYIWGAMRLGGLLTIILISTMLLILWRRERRQNYGAA
ncbi:MAG: SCO family protein [Myxococcales bacterium]|nr:SCO family protein [Myxococcales bacterium]MCB9542941.1 SCO family protein [Myxococcales bacterium]MCB9551560.1 SCO family protein [Myxococcales bacterium]